MTTLFYVWLTGFVLMFALYLYAWRGPGVMTFWLTKNGMRHEVELDRWVKYPTMLVFAALWPIVVPLHLYNNIGAHYR